MSAASLISPSSRSSWDGRQGLHQAYDPSQSFAYTSAYSGVRAASMMDPELGESADVYGVLDGVLSRELIHEGLTDLGRIGDGVKNAYLTLSLSELLTYAPVKNTQTWEEEKGFGLVDISLLSSYPYIQRLTLTSNSLTDILVLSNLPSLVYLDVSYNKLTSILDFEPPKNLTEANFAHNEIEEMCNLTEHKCLTKLILSCNQIRAIKGISCLSQLTYLDLSENRIERIMNLKALPLRHLDLSLNCIRVIENLGCLTQLQTINLSGNTISSLKGLEGHHYLSDINMEDNKIVDIKEVEHLKGLRLLRTLNLSKNPVETLLDYRSTVIHHLPSLSLLDRRRVDIKEKVAACNTLSPTAEVVAAQDHRTNVMGSVKKPARLRFSTLTRIDEPYPMLVLCGPPGSGKGYFCKLLVEEFPNFFGLGVSHTTCCQKAKESHGRDYYFINENTFSRAVKLGEFVQTYRTSKGSYGLTMAAIEQVAQQGLACVTHMSIEGVLTMKTTHFEPRYILMLPLTPQIHEQRLKAEGCYGEEEIKGILRDVHSYKSQHQERPGFFDTAINTDSIRDGYHQLRSLVMAYGDISPDSPLSLTSGSQLTTQQTTSVTTSERTTPLLTTHTPSLIDPIETLEQFQDSSDPHSYPKVDQYQTDNPEAVQNIHSVAKSWSRPPSSSSRSGPSSRPVSGGDGQRGQGVRTPVSDHGGRRHKQIIAAVGGKEYIYVSYTDSNASTSRPGTSMSKSNEVDINPRQTLEEEDSSEESSEEAEQSASPSLSKLSSERAFSPEQPASPPSMD